MNKETIRAELLNQIKSGLSLSYPDMAQAIRAILAASKQSSATKRKQKELAIEVASELYAEELRAEI